MKKELFYETPQVEVLELPVALSVLAQMSFDLGADFEDLDPQDEWYQP